MPAALDPALVEHWYTALRSTSGVRIRVVIGDRTLYKQKLYQVRASLSDEQLKSLSITDDPKNADCIFIVHSRS